MLGKLIMSLFLVFVILFSGCVGNTNQTDNSNLATSQSALTSEEQQDSGEKNDNAVGGCCVPTCTPSGVEECQQAGGNFVSLSCNQVKECKQSCCTPVCQESTEVYCTQVGGTSTGTTCDAVKECKKSCCTPFCTELTKYQCETEYGYGGIWQQDKACSECEDCDKKCCSLGRRMTETECEQLGGEQVDEKQCVTGGKITIEVYHNLSCNCNKEGYSDKICTESMNLTQKYTANFTFDKTSYGGFFGGGNTYKYKGKGTLTLDGKRNKLSSVSGTVFCYATKSESAYATEDESEWAYNGSTVSDEITAEILEQDGNYYITYNIPFLGAKSTENWSRTTDSECPTTSPGLEEDTYEDMVEAIIIAPSLDNVQLSGTKTFTQGPPESAYACEGSNNDGQGTITWSFDLGE